MRITENRKLAWGVLAACVLMSVFGLGGGALSRERGSVLKVFNSGADTTLETRHSMDAYLDSAAEEASIMVNEAEIYLGESTVGNEALANARIVGDDSATLDQRYSAYEAMKSQLEKLYSSMSREVDEAKRGDFKLAYDNLFKGIDDLIKRDEYHALAADYNDLISGFPGGVVAAITRNGTLDTFGG